MRLRFVLSQISQGLRRNLAMTVSVILVTFVSLVFVGAGLLIQTQIDRIKGDWYDKVEVSIYFCPEISGEPQCAGGRATQDDIDSVKELLDSPALAQYVDEVHFEDREAAYESFVEDFGDHTWVANTTPAMMSDSFRVKLLDLERADVITEAVSGRPGVDVVQDQRDLLQGMFQVMNGLTVIALALAVVMTIAAVLLITTTIRLSALNREKETSIMRLVGASNLFIQLPFMLEGAIAALIGSGLAIGTLWAGVKFGVEGWLADSIRIWPFIGTGDLWLIAPLLVGIGIVLAAISSLVSLSRYTKV